jgi:hypothetical protein
MLPWLLVAIGAFAALGGIKNWDWFMNNRRARLFVTILGRDGARVFYVLLGLFIAGIGFAGLAGVVEMDR